MWSAKNTQVDYTLPIRHTRYFTPATIHIDASVSDYCGHHERRRLCTIEIASVALHHTSQQTSSNRACSNRLIAHNTWKQWVTKTSLLGQSCNRLCMWRSRPIVFQVKVQGWKLTSTEICSIKSLHVHPIPQGSFIYGQYTAIDWQRLNGDSFHGLLTTELLFMTTRFCINLDLEKSPNRLPAYGAFVALES